MGRRASFVIRKNGIDTYLFDHYVAGDIVTPLFYGLDSALDMFDWGREDTTILDEVWAEAAAIIDLDAKVLMFWGSDRLLDNVPLIPYIINFMETVTWHGWDVRHAKWGMLSMADYLGLPRSSVCATYQKPSEESRKYHFNWWLTAEDNDYVHTIISHRKLNGNLSNYTIELDLEDTLTLGEDLLKIIQDREISSLPHQKEVDECLYIDEINKTIHIFWGYPLGSNALVYQLDLYWSGWQVKWIDEGYAGHLKLIGYKQDDLLIPALSD